MCGIVGYIGKREAQEVILQGLEKLEYRGYDSAGVALDTSDKLIIKKAKGPLKVLEKDLKKDPIHSNTGIGHTRWATHGAPTNANAHPHSNSKGTIALVHNGILENHQELKSDLLKKGVEFKSQTDTEVMVHVIDSYYEGDLFEAVQKAIKVFKGSYALAIISSNHPNELIAVRKESPLVVGLGEGESFIASDIPALLKYTNKVYFLENGELVHLTKNQVEVYDEKGARVQKKVFKVDWDLEAASKGGYEHYTLKEIHEQPQALENTLLRRITESGHLNLGDINFSRETIESFHKVYIVACGTSYHAGLVGSRLIEQFAKIPVETDIASEFRYRNPFLDEHTLMIVISQSGETADTLAAMREAKEKGSRVLAITNVVGSSIAREADDVFYTWAGPEIGVCSTKAYTTQLISLYMLAFYLAYTSGVMDLESYLGKINTLKAASKKVEEVLKDKDVYLDLAKHIKDVPSAFYIGRGLDYLTSLEGALKLKEISYIHTESFPAGELKHGTIALIEEGTPVFVMACQDELLEKTLSNMQEVAARGAYTIVLVQRKNRALVENQADLVLSIPDVEDWMTPIIATVPTQLIAYYTSLVKGNDVDKPRNLAKSVTVE